MVAVKNPSRTAEKARNIELFVDSLRDLDNLDTSRYGELNGRNIYSNRNSRTHALAPGEIDLIPMEIPVLCSERLVRVILKVPQPQQTEDKGHMTGIYERKVIVPLDDVCLGRTIASETPFQGADLSSTD